jgi:23S rRNA (adenine2503-C2)-methyltransferase
MKVGGSTAADSTWFGCVLGFCCSLSTLLLAAPGHDSKRAIQLWKAMYNDKSWIRSLDDADATAHRFAAAFKTTVREAGSLAGGLTLQSVSTARDGTHKLVFAVHGGPGGNVETVLIPMRNRCVKMTGTCWS